MKQEFYSDIIKRIRSGDHKAISELVKKTMNLALLITNNVLYKRSEIEDTIQDIYLKIWENLDQYDETEGKFISWFSRIAQNQCIDRNRKIRVNIDENIPENKLDDSPPVDEKIHNSDLKNEIMKISLDLPDKQREVFILRDIQNLTLKEVQKQTGLSTGSIKTNLYLARKKIKELLDPEWRKL